MITPTIRERTNTTIAGGESTLQGIQNYASPNNNIKGSQVKAIIRAESLNTIEHTPTIDINNQADKHITQLINIQQALMNEIVNKDQQMLRMASETASYQGKANQATISALSANYKSEIDRMALTHLKAKIAAQPTHQRLQSISEAPEIKQRIQRITARQEAATSLTRINSIKEDRRDDHDKQECSPVNQVNPGRLKGHTQAVNLIQKAPEIQQEKQQDRAHQRPNAEAASEKTESISSDDYHTASDEEGIYELPQVKTSRLEEESDTEDEIQRTIKDNLEEMQSGGRPDGIRGQKIRKNATQMMETRNDGDLVQRKSSDRHIHHMQPHPNARQESAMASSTIKTSGVRLHQIFASQTILNNAPRRTTHQQRTIIMRTQMTGILTKRHPLYNAARDKPKSEPINRVTFADEQAVYEYDDSDDIPLTRQHYVKTIMPMHQDTTEYAEESESEDDQEESQKEPIINARTNALQTISTTTGINNDT